MNIRYGLTPRENDALNFLQFYMSGSENQIGPTCREIMIAMGLQSTSGVSRLLNSLEDKGWIKRISGKARAISLVNHAALRNDNERSNQQGTSARQLETVQGVQS